MTNDVSIFQIQTVAVRFSKNLLTSGVLHLSGSRCVKRTVPDLNFFPNDVA